MPSIAVISDIHGNLQALKAVLKFLDSYKPDSWICLGDLVGYGPNPAECVELIISRNIPCVMGNHDAGVAGILNLSFFKNPNRRLIEITRDLLSDDQISWLKKLPYKIEDNDKRWIAVHANPIFPKKWEYVDSAIKARSILKDIESEICFLGHTHIPGIVSNQIGVNNYKEGYKYIINPGSVGQSRDGDFRASCCIVNTENYELTIKRVAYNIEKVLSDLTELGFTRKEAHHLLRA